jgi:ATP-dependent protease ClpP protease subunit
MTSDQAREFGLIDRVLSRRDEMEPKPDAEKAT